MPYDSLEFCFGDKRLCRMRWIAVRIKLLAWSNSGLLLVDPNDPMRQVGRQGYLEAVIPYTVCRDGAHLVPVPRLLSNIRSALYRGRTVWLDVRLLSEKGSNVSNDPAVSRPSMTVREV